MPPLVRRPQEVVLPADSQFLNQAKVMPGQLALCTFENSIQALCKIYPNDDELLKRSRTYEADLRVNRSVVLLPKEIVAAPKDSKLLEVTKFYHGASHSTLKEVELLQDEPVEFRSIKVDLFINAKRYKEALIENRDALERALRSLLSVYTFMEWTLIDVEGLKENYGISKVLINDADSRLGYIGSNTTIHILQTYSWTGHRLTNLVGNDQLEECLTSLINFKSSYRIHWPRSKFLLIGPSGTGKTSLTRNLAIKLNCHLLEMAHNEVTQSLPGGTESALRSIFNKAHRLAKIFSDQKTIIFIKNIENLCPRDVNMKDSSHIKRSSLLLMNLLEDITDERVVVVATTANIEDVNPNLRRPGRINEEYFIKMPDQGERELILTTLLTEAMETREMISSLAHQLSYRTNGYVAADLALVVRHLERGIAKKVKLGEDVDHDASLDSLVEEVIHKVRPSVGKGDFECRSLAGKTFDSIGGMEQLKQTIRLSVLGPLKQPEVYERFGLAPPRGILLYGPPGCAKTTFAQCIANETNMSFLSTSAAEVYSPYVGKAERYLVKMFNQARAMAPSIIFLDEIDALVGNRSGRTNDVQTRILSALLIEMDGIGGSAQSAAANKSKAILVIAATNRPDMIDDALMRPGRFDRLIHVSAPDKEGVLAILEKLKTRIALSEDVDLKEIAAHVENFSGADLVNLCNEAALIAATEDLDAKFVTAAHFSQALADVRPSLTLEQIKKYETFEKRHIAG